MAHAGNITVETESGPVTFEPIGVEGDRLIMTPVKRLELKAISDQAFGLFDGDTLLRYLLFEVKIELRAPGFNRTMTLIADPRDARVLGPYGDLEITFGDVSFLRSKDQVEILWRYPEAPWCFPENVGDEVTISRFAEGGLSWSGVRAERGNE